MSDGRDKEFEERVERWGREVGRKAEEWGRHVERKAEDWGRHVEYKAERLAQKFERKSERRAERKARWAERQQRWAERREDKVMRRRERFSGERGTTLYRSRTGMICGVCKGLALYYGFDVFWTRVGAVAFSTFTGVWPAVFLYIVAAMVMKPEPVLPLESEEDEEFYHSYSGSRTMALHRLKRTYDNLNRRIQRLENTVTARDFDWDERLNR